MFVLAILSNVSRLNPVYRLYPPFEPDHLNLNGRGWAEDGRLSMKQAEWFSAVSLLVFRQVASP
jgi:hypothetical protein